MSERRTHQSQNSSRAASDIASSDPKVSVIIPVYNVKSTLRRCLNSILAQTYTGLEIILVDDGSTDGSGELCDQLGRKDTRIKIIHQPNQGLSAARNAGLDQMTGDFVTFVDSDDTIEPNLIEHLYQAVQKLHVKLAIGSFAEVFPDGRHKSFVAGFLASNASLDPGANNDQSSSLATHSIPVEPKILLYDTTSCLVQMLGEQGFTLMACGKLYARELFDQVRFPVGALYEDVGTTYRLVLQCPEIAFVPEPLYHYYQNPESIVHQTFSKQKLGLITLTDKMCDDIASSNLEQTKQLKFALARRRMHARFSVLRQITVLPRRERQQFQSEQIKIIRYLRHHKADILKNPLASSRDRLAMRTLLLGLPIFRLAWRAYEKLR